MRISSFTNDSLLIYVILIHHFIANVVYLYLLPRLLYIVLTEMWTEDSRQLRHVTCV